MQQRNYSQARSSRRDEPGRYGPPEGNRSPERGYRQNEASVHDDDRREFSDDRYASSGDYSGRRDYRDDPWSYRANQESTERDWSSEPGGRYMSDFPNREQSMNRDYGRNQFGREDVSPSWGPSRAGQFNEYGPGPGNWSGGDYRNQYSDHQQDRHSDRHRDSSGQMRDDRGRFAGTGPKNYRRSDDRVQDDLCEQLTRHPEIDATDIDCKVKDGEVTLSGTVSDRHMKRFAEDLAENISGVKDVRNEIRVKREGSNGSEHPPSDQGQRANKTATKM